MPRLALSLETLRAQLNALAPNRSKVSDGWIGDAAHSARKSDHNPNRSGVVCALDITHDPENGMDCHKLAEWLVASQDFRIAYIIWNGRICSGSASDRRWTWRTYTGPSPHTKHIHISVYQDPEAYDSARPWELKSREPILTVNGKRVPLLVQAGISMAPVRALAEALGAKVDFDPKTGDVTVSK